MSWRVYCTGLALLTLAGLFLLTDQLLFPPGPTERNIRRIRPGMTQAKVEALLGGLAHGSAWIPERRHRKFEWRWWEGPAGTAWVTFNGDGEVCEAWFTPSP